MKISSRKILSMALIVLGAHSSQLFAHDQLGNLGALKGAGATDVYEVVCYTDPTYPSQAPTHQLFFTIRNDSNNGAVLSAQAWKITASGTVLVTNTTDPTPGDYGTSPDTILAGGGDGDQVYYVAVNHSAKFGTNYLLSFHCQDAQGIHTGTDIVTVQNQ